MVVLVGGGDNGGDALSRPPGWPTAARAVTALTVSAKLHEDGAAAASARRRSVIREAGGTPTSAAGSGGPGARRDGRHRRQRWAAPGRGAARRLVAARAAPLAVDVPSGVDADTGAVAGRAVRAAATDHLRHGQAGPAGAARAPQYAGASSWSTSGSSLPPADLEQLERRRRRARCCPTRARSRQVHPRASLGITAGSDAYPGAAVLCTGGARRGGAGYLRFAGPAHPAELVRQRFPDVVATEVAPGDGAAVLAAGRVQAWVVGPGLGTDDAAAAVVQAVLGADVPVLVDADGLTIVAEHREWLRERADRGQPTLLTPHEGEFARLVGGDPDDVGAARRRPAGRGAPSSRPSCRATVLLKGSTTLVVDPDGRARVNGTGTGWLASAGSGDVLSGVAGALLAAGLTPLEPAASAPGCTAWPRSWPSSGRVRRWRRCDLLDALARRLGAGAAARRRERRR